MKINNVLIIFLLFCLPSITVVAESLPHNFFRQEKKIYRIAKEIDLAGEIIQLPSDVIIKFKRKGKLTNGGLIGDHAIIISDKRVRFDDNFCFGGTFDCAFEYEWLYESSCTVIDTTIYIYGKEYKVKTAKGVNQWKNIQTVFGRLNNAFPELHFNKSYVLDNPNGETKTSANILQITDRVENMIISGGVFHNAGLAFYNWSNIVIKDLFIIGRYHDYSDNSIDINWTEFHKEDGQSLGYNAVGIQLTSSMFNSATNSNALVENVSIKNCYNGVSVGRWTGQDKKIRTVENVTVNDCIVTNVVYHSYLTCNCNNIQFNRNVGRNSYLGMYVDISRGSSNVQCSYGYGENFPQPFKIASNNEYLLTENCIISSNHVVVNSILNECTLGPSIIVSGNGLCKIINNEIVYEDNYGVTMFSIESHKESSYILENNRFSNSPFYSFVRYTVANNGDSKSNIVLKDNIVDCKYDGKTLYGVIIDDLRKEENRTDIIVDFSNNIINSSNLYPAKLQLLRRQGYSKSKFTGKLIFKDNVHPFVVQELPLLQKMSSGAVELEVK